MTKDYLTEALTNRTFDADATELALRKSLDNSFSYLYRLQRNLVQYEEYHYTTRNIVETPDYGDLFVDKYERVCMNFPVQLVRPHEMENYKRSKYFLQEVTFDELVQEKEIFTRIPIILVDNQVLRRFSVIIYEDSFTMILPFERNFVHGKPWDPNVVNLNGTYGDNVYKEHRIDAQIIRNASFFDIETNSAMLRRNSYDKKSFDRILNSYMEALNPSAKMETNGIYFAVLYTAKGDKLGSFLQEVSIDENGDYVIHWDEKTEQRLHSGGAIIIRFIFYRYLKKYTCWHENDDILVRELPNKTMSSEIAMIYKSKHTYEMAIPTENLLVFHRKEEGDNWTHFNNEDVIIKYPNLYHIENNVENGDTLHLFYFYAKGYDLHYEHKYWWFFAYLYMKFGEPKGKTIQQVVNEIYFDDLNLVGQFTLDSYLDDIDENKLYEFTIHGMELRDDLIENRWRPYVGNDAIITEPEKPIRPYIKNVRWPNTTLNIMGFSEMAILRFRNVFNMLINIDAMDYRYDDIDYMRYFEKDLSPLEYKIMKLKSFIKDDMRCLHDYLLIENKTSIKEHFRIDEEAMRSRIRIKTEIHGDELPEPMYLFTFEKLHPKDDVSCRIFIDGFIFSKFIHESHGFSDFVYIPIRALQDGVDVEIEIFPCFMKHYSITFDNLDDIKYLEFNAKKDIIPTLSDIVFYKAGDIYIPYSHDDFSFTIISDDYHYKTKDGKVTVYVIKESYQFTESIWYDNITNDYYKLYADDTVEHFNPNGDSLGFLARVDLPYGLINVAHNGMKANRSLGYYDRNGRHFTSNGQPDFENNISTFLLSEMIENGQIEEIEVSPTDNICDIHVDEKYINYRDVIAGSSILNPENKGVNNTKVFKVAVQLKNEELVGQEIAVKIEKDSGYVYRTFEQSDYPAVNLNLIDPYLENEFIRVFKNGRIISKKRYAFLNNFKTPRIQTLDKFKTGDDIFLDATPYRNRLVYYKAELPRTFMVDLKGFIEKPFDSRYYEVYLNGRRLHEKNLYPLSGWLIQLGGCHSRYNLEIYEKDRDWEYYACDFGDYYTVGDLLYEPFMEADFVDKIIKLLYPDIPPNDNTEERQPYDSDVTLEQLIFEMFYYGRLLPLGLATADSSGWDEDDIRENFNLIYNLYLHFATYQKKKDGFLDNKQYVAITENQIRDIFSSHNVTPDTVTWPDRKNLFDAVDTDEMEISGAMRGDTVEETNPNATNENRVLEEIDATEEEVLNAIRGVLPDDEILGSPDEEETITDKVLFLNPDIFYDQLESEGRKWRVYLTGEQDLIEDVSTHFTEDPDDDYGLYIKRLEEYIMELESYGGDDNGTSK